MSERGSLIYLYGPPAVGKPTVAEHLQRLTGFRLLHNHLTVKCVESVFEFTSDPSTEALHRVRFDVSKTAVRHGVDLTFTNNSLRHGSDGRARFESFTATVRSRVEDLAGHVVFVQLTAPAEVLELRGPGEYRRRHEKLVDPTQLRTILQGHDPSPLDSGDLVIDTSQVAPDDAARRILDALGPIN